MDPCISLAQCGIMLSGNELYMSRQLCFLTVKGNGLVDTWSWVSMVTYRCHTTLQLCKSKEYLLKEWTNIHNSIPSCMYVQYILLKQQEKKTKK